MRTVTTVNGARGRNDTASPKDRIAIPKVTEHVDALARTLAPESRHIVAFELSGTTSRAAELILLVVVFGVNVVARFFAPGEG
jgi:hypothetical protein